MSNERAERLEERVAWLEHHVTAQDKAMLELHEQLAHLRRELLQVRSRLEPVSTGENAPLTDDERPPHY